MNLPKIVCVLGPTASGKSDMAVEIALRFGGEVISADSRQVYRGLDIATGKITKEEMRGVPHHLLDVADPKDQYSVSHFKRDAEKAIDDILSRGKLPILCGGTYQYIQAVADNFITPEIPPDASLRDELSKRTTDELLLELQTLDPARAKKIDPKNPRRLVRAIEIARTLGAVPEVPDAPKKYDALKIAIQTDKETLRERIVARVKKRFALGMAEEAEKLHQNGLPYERMNDLGLEYRYLAKFLQGKISREKLEEEVAFKDWQYAKRQLTWLRSDKAIEWFSLSETDKLFERIKDFLS